MDRGRGNIFGALTSMHAASAENCQPSDGTRPFVNRVRGNARINHANARVGYVSFTRRLKTAAAVVAFKETNMAHGAHTRTKSHSSVARCRRLL